MNYFRENQRIQADFAHRVGKISATYAEATKAYPADEVYEVTLHICLLQNLLTSCYELIKEMNRRERKKSFFKAPLTDIPSFWGLRSSMVVSNTFCHRSLTYGDVIEHLRNALSHPTKLDLNCEFPSTGFDSVQPLNGQISTVCFVDSPEVKRYRVLTWREKTKAETYIEGKLTFPHDIVIEEITDGSETKYQLFYEGKPFARVFRMDVPIDNLKQFVLGLSEHLAIAAQPKWEEYLAAKEDEQMKIAIG